MKLFLGLLTALVLCACSSIESVKASKSKVDLSVVQQLNYGNITQLEIVQLIGKPDQIISVKRELIGKEAWIYSETDGGQSFERLGLLIDQKTGIVQSATWSVREGDSLYRKDSAISYFKNAKFSENQVGRVASDYYSDDSVLSDSQLGISVYVDGAKQTTESISFEGPTQRKLAKP